MIGVNNPTLHKLRNVGYAVSVIGKIDSFHGSSNASSSGLGTGSIVPLLSYSNLFVSYFEYDTNSSWHFVVEEYRDWSLKVRNFLVTATAHSCVK